MAKIATTVQKKESSRQTNNTTEKERLEIERLAYQFFLERSGGHGHDQEDWLRAEATVRARRSR